MTSLAFRVAASMAVIRAAWSPASLSRNTWVTRVLRNSGRIDPRIFSWLGSYTNSTRCSGSSTPVPVSPSMGKSFSIVGV